MQYDSDALSHLIATLAHSRYRMLTCEELRDLIYKYRAFPKESIGIRARNRVIEGNMRLVIRIAKRMARSRVLKNLTLMDLVQEGVFGLNRAVELFDPDRGIKFSTYADWWIKQAINRGIKKQERTVTIPVSVLDFLYRIRKARDIIRDRKTRAGERPVTSIDEIAYEINISFRWRRKKPYTGAELLDVLRLTILPYSIDRPMRDDEDGDSIAESLVDSQPDQLEVLHQQDEAEEVLAKLSESQRGVVERHFGFGRALSEANELGDGMGNGMAGGSAGNSVKSAKLSKKVIQQLVDEIKELCKEVS